MKFTASYSCILFSSWKYRICEPFLLSCFFSYQQKFVNKLALLNAYKKIVLRIVSNPPKLTSQTLFKFNNFLNLLQELGLLSLFFTLEPYYLWKTIHSNLFFLASHGKPLCRPCFVSYSSLFILFDLPYLEILYVGASYFIPLIFELQPQLVMMDR